MKKPIRVTIWNEFRHEKQNEFIAKLYPNGIHGAIAEGLEKIDNLEIQIATLDQPEHGLTDVIVDNTDVMIWWAHTANSEVKDEIVDKLHHRILDGMGFIALHSSIGSKIFRRLMGTNCDVKWRESGEKERIWIVDHAHPIVDGLGEYFELSETEMYGEPFGVPTPDQLVFISWFPGGEVFRSGCCYFRGRGRIFYFRPGHETYPIFFDPNIRKVIANAVKWAAPTGNAPTPIFGNSKPIEKI